MKTTYIQPKLEIIEIETEEVMSASVKAPTSLGGNSTPSFQEPSYRSSFGSYSEE